MPSIANAASLVNGATINCTSLTLAAGLPVACVGDTVNSHPAAPFGVGVHVGAVVSQGSAITKSGGRPVAYVGSLCSCGHAISTGDPLVQVNG